MGTPRIVAPYLLDDHFEDYEGYCIKLVKFLHFPSTIFIYSGISHLLYLAFFAWMLTMKFCKLPIFHEIMLWIWTFSLFAESIRKALTSDRLHMRKICGREFSYQRITRYVGKWTSRIVRDKNYRKSNISPISVVKHEN